MALKHKIARLRRLKTQLVQLEREILEEGFTLMQTPGQRLLVKPRLERVMEQFG